MFSLALENQSKYILLLLTLLFSNNTKKNTNNLQIIYTYRNLSYNINITISTIHCKYFQQLKYFKDLYIYDYIIWYSSGVRVVQSNQIEFTKKKYK